MPLPKYWRYLDVATFVAIVLAAIGAGIGIYGAYIGISKVGSSIEIYLALIGIILTILSVFVAVLVAVMSTRAIKAELM